MAAAKKHYPQADALSQQILARFQDLIPSDSNKEDFELNLKEIKEGNLSVPKLRAREQHLEDMLLEPNDEDKAQNIKEYNERMRNMKSPKEILGGEELERILGLRPPREDE